MLKSLLKSSLVKKIKNLNFLKKWTVEVQNLNQERFFKSLQIKKVQKLEFRSLKNKNPLQVQNGLIKLFERQKARKKAQ